MAVAGLLTFGVGAGDSIAALICDGLLANPPAPGPVGVITFGIGPGDSIAALVTEGLLSSTPAPPANGPYGLITLGIGQGGDLALLLRDGVGPAYVGAVVTPPTQEASPSISAGGSRRKGRRRLTDYSKADNELISEIERAFSVTEPAPVVAAPQLVRQEQVAAPPAPFEPLAPLDPGISAQDMLAQQQTMLHTAMLNHAAQQARDEEERLLMLIMQAT